MNAHWDIPDVISYQLITMEIVVCVGCDIIIACVFPYVHIWMHLIRLPS